MSQNLAPITGDGSDGDLVVTSQLQVNTYTDLTSGTYSTGQTLVNVGSNSGFEDGCLVKVVQSRGSNVGVYEYNRVQSSTASSITLRLPLSNTYISDASAGSANRAQIIRIPEYKGVHIQTGGSLVPQLWGDWTGGEVIIFCKGRVRIQGNGVNANACGFRARNNTAGNDNTGWNGEGSAGRGDANTVSRNGSGGGAGGDGSGAKFGGGGGGAGHANNGSLGTTGQGAPDNRGEEGLAVGNSSLTEMHMGGAGGSGGVDGQGTTGAGGDGGGCITIICDTLDVEAQVSVDGQNGENATTFQAGGGGGAGGSIFIRARVANLGTNLVRAPGGSGGSGSAGGGNGGAGSVGRIRIEAGKVTGSISQGSVSQVIGGLAFLGKLGPSI